MLGKVQRITLIVADFALKNKSALEKYFKNPQNIEFLCVKMHRNVSAVVNTNAKI